MTSIMFRPAILEEERDEVGAMLKEICALPQLSNVRLSENNVTKDFYIADLAEGADALATIKALRGIKGVRHIRQGSSRDELEAYVAKHAKMEPMDQITEMILAEPHGAIGYLSKTRKDYNAGAIKALFNHAAVPQPKDLVLAPDDAKYSITRAQKASLVYKTARNAGDGVLRSAALWLRTR